MAHGVTLSWLEADSVDGYNVYRGITSGAETAVPLNGTTLVSALTYTDSTVVFGQTYDYVVTAVKGGIESPHSNEAVAAVNLPSPPNNVVAKAF